MHEVDGVIDISKTDDKKGLVFGWASVIKKDGEIVVDRQNDVVDDEWELEKSAYQFVASCRVGGEEHVRKGVSHLIESMVITTEKIEAMGWPDSTPIGWWTGWQITDPDVMKGMVEKKYTAFSIHGTGRRSPITKGIEGMTFNDITDMVRSELCATTQRSCWVRDISMDWVVYEISGSGPGDTLAEKTFRRSYSMDAEGKITLGDAEEVSVKRKTTYITKGVEALARFNALKEGAHS